jgi:hypothetical protein
MSIIAGYDCTHDNLGRAPRGAQLAGYTTGSSGIQWTEADWDANPNAVRIDQDFNASDPSADVLDVENGAATFGDCPVWAKRAAADFDSAARPGQRTPAIYFSASNVHLVANALLGGGVTGGVGFWVASWGIGEASAMEMVAAASGPFPIIGVQYNNGTFYDYDVFDGAWLGKVSGAPSPGPHAHHTDGRQTIGDYAHAVGMRSLGFSAYQGAVDEGAAQDFLRDCVPPAGREYFTP